MAAPAVTDASLVNKELLAKLAEPGTHACGKLTVTSCQQITKKDGSKANMYEVYFAELGNLRVAILPLQGSKVKPGDCEDTVIESKPKDNGYTGMDYKVTKFGAAQRGGGGGGGYVPKTPAEIHSRAIAILVCKALELARTGVYDGDNPNADLQEADRLLGWMSKRYESSLAHFSKPVTNNQQPATSNARSAPSPS